MNRDQLTQWLIDKYNKENSDQVDPKSIADILANSIGQPPVTQHGASGSWDSNPVVVPPTSQNQTKTSQTDTSLGSEANPVEEIPSVPDLQGNPPLPVTSSVISPEQKKRDEISKYLMGRYGSIAEDTGQAREAAIKKARQEAPGGFRRGTAGFLYALGGGDPLDVAKHFDEAQASKEKGINAAFDKKKADISNDIVTLAKFGDMELEQQAKDPNSKVSEVYRSVLTSLMGNLPLQKDKDGKPLLDKDGKPLGPNTSFLIGASANDLAKSSPQIATWFKGQIDYAKTQEMGENRKLIAKMAADAKANVPAKPTVGQAQTDRIFAKEYNDFVLSGKFSDSVKSLDQLDEAINILKKSAGGATGAIPSLVPDALRARIPGLKGGYNAEQMVKEIVQRNLRPILGAQFTEREGTMLMERAFDPKLSEATNIKRIERLGTQIRKMAQAKQEAIYYYEENGTLAGFKGKIPTIKDIYPETGIREPKMVGTGEIARKDPSTGKNVIFDAKTKKALRYE
jgi:hypothetical protein